MNNTYYLISNQLNKIPIYFFNDPTKTLPLRVNYIDYSFVKLSDPYILSDKKDYVVFINPDLETLTMLRLLGIRYRLVSDIDDYYSLIDKVVLNNE